MTASLVLILVTDLSVLRGAAQTLPGDDALLHGLGDGGPGVLDVALLLVVLAAHILGGGGVLRDVHMYCVYCTQNRLLPA